MLKGPLTTTQNTLKTCQPNKNVALDFTEIIEYMNWLGILGKGHCTYSLTLSGQGYFDFTFGPVGGGFSPLWKQ